MDDMRASTETRVLGHYLKHCLFIPRAFKDLWRGPTAIQLLQVSHYAMMVGLEVYSHLL